jgi:hypothetical protein
MKHSVFKPVWALMLMTAVLMVSAPASAAPSDSGKQAAVSKSKKKAGPSGQIKFLPGSEETTKERSSRLKRECKGRVNAGACAGYTY